jgi:acyl-coenzyme A synthetase/AMP-(fatty) acid ligase
MRIRIETPYVWRDRVFLTGGYQAASGYLQDLTRQSLIPGSVVSVEADFSPSAVALMLALIEHKCIVVPLADAVGEKKPEFCGIAEVEDRIIVQPGERVEVRPTSAVARHRLLRELKEAARPGLVLFSSGSTGQSKAALHDFARLLEKFKVSRRAYRTMAFLLFDHIGGLNTLFHTLSNGGCIVTAGDRRTETVSRTIQKHRVQLLPTSPTFMNLLLLSESYKGHDLSSLELVTYGTEVMPETTLARFHALFPNARLHQTYGLSEVGILRSKSRSSDSLWVRVGGEGFETRVVNGLLEIKAQSAMLGYLNAPTPFTEDGWFQTGDAVEVDGEYIRILGRKSEIINVGGEKVYPAEVESVLGSMEGVDAVAVSADSSPITGQIVKAKVKLRTAEPIAEFRKRMRAFCEGRLSKFKIPQKVVLVSEDLHSERFKRTRW